ncbi:MAG: energy transducer TonB [Gammaproteobacteria bacterium]|nr:energy transducer TonB [Gammaproteobacteria bacterium]
MMMRSSASNRGLNNSPDSQHAEHDAQIKVMTLKPDSRQAQVQALSVAPVIIVLAIVTALHAGLLVLILPSSSVQQATVSLPVIAGVLIQAPSSEIVKTPKKKAAPAHIPKAKRIPAAKKTITRPPPAKKPAVSEVQQTTNVAEEAVEAEQQPAALVAPRIDATRQSNPAPVYPRASLRRHEQGKVILQVLILSDGSVGKVQIKQSSGFKRLDRSAIKAVKRWRYVPAQQGEQAVEYWYQQPIVFSLRQ